jgi:hypothetical protein
VVPLYVPSTGHVNEQLEETSSSLEILFSQTCAMCPSDLLKQVLLFPGRLSECKGSQRVQQWSFFLLVVFFPSFTVSLKSHFPE